MKKFICFFLCLITILATCTSCSRPPKIEDIEARLGELIEASYEVNDLLFGEGPDTYERVYDPKSSLKFYKNKETGETYYYYYIEDKDVGKILAYRDKAYGNDFKYLLVTDKEDAKEAEKLVYTDDEEGLCFFSIEYEEKKAEFYYDSQLPEDYDVVRLDEKYLTVDQIKASAEKVYSADYLSSIYETLFTGVLISDDVSSGLMTARYVEYEDAGGDIWFMKSNTYEPLMKEKRIFDVSTAEIARGSNAKRVRIEIDSYLESKPEEIERVIINLAIQDGVWYLDNGTY